jgi:hypothetical protein
VPTSVPKPTRSVPQVSIAHDIIAVEDAASLVATEFHCDPLRDAGPDHVADGRSPEVVRNARRTAGRRSCPPPRLVEAAATPQAASPYDAKLVSIYFTNSSMTNVTANAEA